MAPLSWADAHDLVAGILADIIEPHTRPYNKPMSRAQLFADVSDKLPRDFPYRGSLSFFFDEAIKDELRQPEIHRFIAQTGDTSYIIRYVPPASVVNYAINALPDTITNQLVPIKERFERAQRWIREKGLMPGGGPKAWAPFRNAFAEANAQYLRALGCPPQ